MLRRKLFLKLGAPRLGVARRLPYLDATGRCMRQ
ncbi:hypothetical protein SAMN05443248_1122 [Bradyrhizobium erythrophlei]|uniref:Uncharacterized protein n=1 Tax=Bradyrhizobium erythrophlei TaxID=1437360 RepID=A0A1M5ITR2_9BRAD|nr:hypothetical protein SAMN05443248_1122 [Bradyrhizobium erythrophlei]